MKVKKITDAYEIGDLDVIYLYNGGLELFKFIESIGKDNKDIMRIKLTNYIEFDKPVKLVTPTSDLEFTNIEDLLWYINDEDLKKYKIITENKTDLFKLLQNLSYVQIFINIYTKEDLKWLNVYESLYHNIGMFENATIQLLDMIKNTNIDNYGYKDVKELFIKKLENIYKNVIDIKSRNLKVSVLASKKSGKSVFVNSILKDWYSPTSLELPTPNICRFIPSKNKEIVFKYRGQEMRFEKPKDLYKYLEKIYIEARDKNEGLDDMEVYYRVENEDYSYETLDTPGPNLAGATKHREITERVIRESDVAIFLIDYTKHLESDEEEFLKHLKTEFEKYGKVHSFVIIVNKMDQKFLSEDTNRSGTRILDYIRYKLTLLGYHDFVVFGVSALQYFSALIVERVCSECKNLSGKALVDKLDDLTYQFGNSEESTLINFAYEMSRRYMRMENEENITLERLKELSGIPFALNYIGAVAKDRAMFEKLRNLIYKLDEDKVSIITGLSIIKLQLSENKERLRAIFDIFQSSVDSINKQVEEYLAKRDQDARSASYYTEDIKKNLISSIEELVNKEIENVKDRLSSKEIKSKEEIYLILENQIKKITEEGSIVFSKYIDDIIKQIKTMLDQNVVIVQQKLSFVRDEYNATIKRINEIIKSDMDVDSFFPELKVDIQIKMEDLISILSELVKSTSDIKLDYDEYITREKRGFLFFKKTVYNIRDLDSLIVDIIYAIKKHTYQVFSALEGNIENTLAKLKNKLDEQIKEIDAFAREQLELARNHIEEDSKRAKMALVELAGFTQVFQEVTNVWDNLIKPIQLGS
ncbi:MULTISPECIES: dynamin family protein [unclassified Hydrogenobaculum]|uniref:dynamin family protein n=2 Tax=unclassified Hydrogenobaculum TaxID=2622382 RepID=UPI00020F3D57|nr:MULTISPECIES: dynamin family protein [unclassified Hydrogenobaculum]AEG46209.1 hypothetical protein HydSHO_0522 [Hydrogenobaculum sp. SHO]AGG14854.1 dynamin family protein [Hydrogenobaculum sp. HO]